MWYSNPSIVEILEREINNLRHMEDSSRKALGETRQKDSRSREGKECFQGIIYLFALLPKRARLGAGAVHSLLREALRQTRCGLISWLFLDPDV